MKEVLSMMVGLYGEKLRFLFKNVGTRTFYVGNYSNEIQTVKQSNSSPFNPAITPLVEVTIPMVG